MKDKNENVKAIMDMILEYGLEVEYHTSHCEISHAGHIANMKATKSQQIFERNLKQREHKELGYPSSFTILN